VQEADVTTTVKIKFILPLSAAFFLLSELSGPAFAKKREPITAEQVRMFLKANGQDGTLLIHDEKQMIPMRDGIRLKTDVVRLNKPNEKYPAILVRTPYGPGELHSAVVAYFIKRGYAVVLQTERGLLGSEGTHTFLAGARQDGMDTLSWIAAQPWSNGKVAMFGCSSSAEAQLALSTMGHPALKASVVGAAGAGVGTKGGVTSQGVFYRGGVPLLSAWAGWYAGRQNVAIKPKDLAFLPSAQILPKAGVVGTLYEKAMQRTPKSPEWLQTDYINENDQVKVPMLNLNSWPDVGADETLKLHTAAAKDTENAYVIMGPGSHCAFADLMQKTAEGEAIASQGWGDILTRTMDWVDHMVQEKPGKPANFSAVQAYLQGENKWISADAWPPTNATPQIYYLTAKRALVTSKPGAPSSLGFISNPATPVPSIGDLCCSDQIELPQTSIEKRADVLTFTTAPFTKLTKVMGPIKAQFYASTTVPDADLSVKITWVDKKGISRVMYETMMRLRYRQGFDKQVMMPINVPQLVNIDGLVASRAFKPGERLRIQVAGSNFPNFERNMQTGGNNSLEARPRIGKISLHFGLDTPSKIEVLVLPSF
jgi:uncharacterized protein